MSAETKHAHQVLSAAQKKIATIQELFLKEEDNQDPLLRQALDVFVIASLKHVRVLAVTDATYALQPPLLEFAYERSQIQFERICDYLNAPKLTINRASNNLAIKKAKIKGADYEHPLVVTTQRTCDHYLNALQKVKSPKTLSAEIDPQIKEQLASTATLQASAERKLFKMTDQKAAVDLDKAMQYTGHFPNRTPEIARILAQRHQQNGEMSIYLRPFTLKERDIKVVNSMYWLIETIGLILKRGV